MSEVYQQLSWFEVAGAGALLIVAMGLSLSLRLSLERRLLIAAVRMTVQLFLLGFVLNLVFGLESPVSVGLFMIFMTTVAGHAATRRAERVYRGLYRDCLASVWSGAWFVTAVALFAVVRPEPWYSPQYAIPFLGMVLGNMLNGVSLGVNRLTTDFEAYRPQMEMILTVGGTPWEAARGLVRSAATAAMIPIINAMTIAGLVSLPGMMTGQILAGVEPAEAVKYQILIMFLIAAATGLGTMGVCLLAFRRFFNRNAQLVVGEMWK